MRTIMRLRKLKGWDPTDLADAAGVTVLDVIRAERGDDRMRLGELKAICRALSVPVHVALRDDASEVEARLLNVFRRLPKARRKAWSKLAAATKDGDGPIRQ